MHFSIRRKMFLGLMGVVIIFVVMVNFILYYLLNNIANQEIASGLENSVLAYQRFDEQRKELMLTQANSMAQTAHLKATLTIPGVDSETIYYAGEGLKDISNPELMLIISNNGELLSNINDKNASRMPLITKPGIETALNDGYYYGIWEYNQHYFRIAISPIVVGEQVVGLITIGHRLDNPRSIQLAKEIAGAEVLLSINGQVFSATSKTLTKDKKQKPDLNVLSLASQTGEIIGHNEGAVFAKKIIDGELYFTATIPHQDELGTTIFYRSINSLTSSVDPVRIIILMVSGLTILFGTLLSFRISSRISKPIIELTEVTKKYGKGNFDLRLVPKSKDEVGALAIAFNSMADNITSNRQILLESIEAAEAANIAKSQFLATMSHEIRTPMNGVLGMTELLMETELNARQTRLTETAFHSAESLLGIINNILDFSKIEAGKLTLSTNDFDLRKMLEDTVTTLAEQAHRKKLELLLNIPHDLDSIVHGDSERLRQILINLLGNAIKFTNQGEVQLKVTTENLSQTNSPLQLLFEICDTGSGIAEEQQSHIFESFTQTDSSVTRHYDGTGLGLTISKQLIELMGGDIKLQSNLGKGSCFSFNLSLQHSPVSEIQRTSHELFQEVKILVVDDNATNRDILSKQLSSWGLQCSSVDNAKKALQQLQMAANQNNPYRIALLDWQMPEMDGLSLAKQIQKETYATELSLIILSSDNVDIEQKDNQLYGISRYINKPVFKKPLQDCLLELLGDTNNTKKLHQSNVINSHVIHQGNILLAEDNPVNQQVAQAMLMKLGYLVDIANNGLEAVTAATKKNYDLIFMDYHMPEMDGLEASTRIRQYEQDTGHEITPIIALTADVYKGTEELCLAAGMNAYLKKPFKRKQLQAVLENWLQKQSIDNSNAKETIPQGSAETDDGILNLSVLEELRELTVPSGESLLDKAIALYLENTPAELIKMRLAMEEENASELSKIAHKIKSGSANLGAQFFSNTCASLEDVARKNNLQDAKVLVNTIEENFILVKKALQNIRSSSVVKKASTPAENLFQQHLLLVDDDPNFRLITGETLRAKGFIVDEANNGSEALIKVRKNVPAIILLDAIMDDMDGFETCKELRAMPLLTDVPIIMVTGLDDIKSINLAFDAGASDFIIKPLNHTVLIHHIQFLLRAYRTTSDLRNSKLQLAAAQCIAKLGYWTWDIEKNTFTLSSHLIELIQTKAHNFDGTLDSYLSLVHPDDKALVKDAIESAQDEKDRHHIEYRLKNSDSDYIFVQQETAVDSNAPGIKITGTVQDITQYKNNENLIHQLAYFDPLTGLGNRTYYQKRIKNFINSTKRRNEQFAFLFLDLDGFKTINDSFGHNVGDQFLKAIAERLKKIARDIDFAFRLGGDEFCIIVGNITAQYNAARVAERCLSEINQKLTVENNEINPRVSIGIALYPKDGENERDLMKAADAAMYSAKQAGKQCYAYFTPEMTLMAKHRLNEEQMLRNAIDQNQFILHYQPQISMLTGQVIGLEALIRWQHPERGLVAPIEFISLAESIGIIDQIDNWVLNRACQQNVDWHKNGFPLLQIAVNISPIHFRNIGLLKSVNQVLKNTGLPAEKLELEITENVIQTQGSLEIFSQLKELGIKIALDDFGTGFSSLSSLKHLPIDCLKVDKIFIDDLDNNTHTPLLLGTIIGLAKSFEYKLVAEGVETIDQALIMSGLGCEVVQGYYFSRPVSAEDIPSVINANFTLMHTATQQEH